jgi:signal transduction histidine kinase/CheY-like chemotaxis protein
LRLQELLEETQAQSEELQAQHSELENLNAELEVHSQKLQSSEEELRAQQEELQQTNTELEERNRIISERTRDIKQKAAELEQTTRYKSEFMANMSHELRTPLNSILLLSRYLADNTEKNLTPEQVESVSVILSSGHGLLSLIDELLDLSKIEAGKMELDYQSLEIEDLLSSLHSLFVPVAEEKGIRLSVDNELPPDYQIRTDRMRLEQILKNLLSNALKFTAEGSVGLLARKAGDHLEFVVSDTGIGIPADKLGLVFDAFQQVDGSTRRKFGGTGLGLSISQELARLLGGTITVTSEVSRGSRFVVSLPEERTAPAPGPLSTPLAPEAEPQADVPDGKYLAPVIPDPVEDDRVGIGKTDRILLIIEDDTVFARILLRFCRKNGYKGIVAVRGDQGVSLARQYQPAAVLLDIRLPVMDGWQVMDALKGNPATRHIPIHMMSVMEAKKESRKKGAIDFITKPVDLDQIRAVFSKLEDVWARKQKKVLIVEENPRHATALSYFLETFQVSSLVSKTIDESIDALRNKQVDCVILDMGVPDQNAYGALETVKENPGLEDMPIIVFTGKHLSEAEEGRIRKYADTIVVKTAYSYQRILDEVKLFLHLVEGQQKADGVNGARKPTLLNEALKGKTILLADDDVRNIFSLTKALEVHGMHVLSALDGSEALAKLSAHPETAIVLMDMMMPHMDGYESMSRIRRDARFRTIPVIAVTAKAMLGDREKCISAGASDYISKPVDIDQLTSLLRVWLYDKTK